MLKKMIESRSWDLFVYAVINYLNKKLKTQYLKKECKSDIETWSIDRVLNKWTFHGKDKLSLVNSPKQPKMHAKN